MFIKYAYIYGILENVKYPIQRTRLFNTDIHLKNMFRLFGRNFSLINTHKMKLSSDRK